MSPSNKRILITPGEPAGIGPDITLLLAQQPFDATIIAVADPDLLTQRAKELKLPITLHECAVSDPAVIPHQAGHLQVHPCHLPSAATPGKLQPEHASYVIDTLTLAAHACLDHHADALVTGPVHKGILNQAGIPFTGHTEFFADISHVPHTVMLFVASSMRVALATTHLPLKDVPAAITPSVLEKTIGILTHALKTQFKIDKPTIAVAGLNPHAGEGGYLGREELEVITPTLEQLRQRGHRIIGPLPADTLFTHTYLEQADGIVAMYHDQALPVVKYLGFGEAVNVTLGLPFIRTSVDHGTALDLAGTGKASPESLIHALQLAMTLSAG